MYNGCRGKSLLNHFNQLNIVLTSQLPSRTLTCNLSGVKGTEHAVLVLSVQEPCPVSSSPGWTYVLSGGLSSAFFQVGCLIC